MQRTRRYAALMCTVAVMVFVAVLAVSTEPASAEMRRCQQECDAEYDAGAAYCQSQFGGSGQDYQDCMSDTYGVWQSCSMGAMWCSENPVYLCWVTCNWNGSWCSEPYGCSCLSGC